MITGNELWSFKDLLNLTRSANLRKLSFSDPDYGDNPVCELCNYQVTTLYASSYGDNPVCELCNYQVDPTSYLHTKCAAVPRRARI